ncbi:MAG TPA: hypothetical protein VGI65_21285 [Steroidobacteraceae bacterium]
MSEVDRLSNSGLYPALPIGDRRTSRDDKEGRQRPARPPETRSPKNGEAAEDPGPQRPPKSIIDEYA